MAGSRADLVLALAASAYNFHVRPHIGSIVCLGITFATLCRYETGKISIAKLTWLIPLFVVWTNLHGGVLGGIGTVGLAAAGWCCKWLLKRPSPVSSAKDIAGLAVIIGFCGLALLVNPFGVDMLRAWRDIMGMNLPDLVIEHAPLHPLKPEGFMVLVLGFVYLFLLLGLRRLPRITWLLPLVWLYLSCTRIRHAPFFSIVAVIAIVDLLPYTRWTVWLSKRDFFVEQKSTEISNKKARFVAAAIAGFLFSIAAVFHTTGSETSSIWARPDSEIWPEDLLSELRDIANKNSDGKILNEQQYAGFLIYSVPKLRVLIDGRCELYGEDFLREYMRARKDTQILKRWIAECDIKTALTTNGSSFDRYFATATDWRPVKRGESATLYVRMNADDIH